MATIDLVPESGAHERQLRLLTEQLERERARNAGLERGLTALSERVDELRRENVELRRRLEARAA